MTHNAEITLKEDNLWFIMMLLLLLQLHGSLCIVALFLFLIIFITAAKCFVFVNEASIKFWWF